MERDYKKEYREYHGKPEQIATRAARNKARREMEKKYGKQAEGKRGRSYQTFIKRWQ